VPQSSSMRKPLLHVFASDSVVLILGSGAG
jgi:hypothetical protein